MMMDSASFTSLSPHSSFTTYSFLKPKTPNFLQVRSQSLRDEGSDNMVDANLNVLRARIGEVMKNERLEKTPKNLKNIGWKNNSLVGYYHETQHKNGHAAMLMETMEIVGLVGASFGLVFLSGSLLILLVSVLVHLHT